MAGRPNPPLIKGGEEEIMEILLKRLFRGLITGRPYTRSIP
jgi:hypothetical protein